MKIPVELKRAYLLLNHGPTVLVSAAHNGHENVMAAAWNTALDFVPPKVCVVIDKSSYTRELIEASGEFSLSVPTQNLARITTQVGTKSGRGIKKIAEMGVATFPSENIAAPLIVGAAGWLECKLLPEPEMQSKYDLFFGEVVAAWADPRVFVENRWQFDDEKYPGMRTIHHIAAGNYFLAGAQVSGHAEQ
jgi:flavin reductase (DIM6/NTAB) family NADH-FMN oxidoreductase RutF